MSTKLFKYNQWTQFFKTLEANTPIQKEDPRIDIVDNFIQCIGYPGEGTHAASDWSSGNAWDLSAPVGSNVYSLFDGKVQRVSKSSGGVKYVGVKKIYGDQVSIASNDGNPDVFYTHITTNLNQGQEVKAGDIIGQLIEMPGMPSHLHIGLSQGDLLDYVGGIDTTNTTDSIPLASPAILAGNFKQPGKIYTTQNDPYKYCVINGVWYGKEGVRDPQQPWLFFDEWTSYEKNCKMNEILDERFNGARKSEQIELNRQKFCSFDGDIEKNRQEWLQSIEADQEIIDGGSKPTNSNNNPGNIRYNPDFQGCIGNDGGFCKFATIQHGYKAILTLLKTYYNTYKLNTIRKIISRYAPPVENDTEKYIKILTAESGFGADAPLEEEDLIKLVPGIVKVENSIDIDEDDVQEEIQKAQATDLYSLNSAVYDGDICQIYTPIGFEGEIPTLIIYPLKENAEINKSVVLENYQLWLQKWAFVFPNTHDVEWDDLESDIEDCFDDNDLMIKNLTVLSASDSTEPSIINDYTELSDLRNLILINPIISDSLTKSFEDFDSSVKLFLMVNMIDLEKKYSKDKINDFVIKAKSVMRKNNEETPNEYYRETTSIMETELTKFTLETFATKIEDNINL